MSTVNQPRVIFVGDAGVGKTALIHRMKTNTFKENTLPTLGAGVTDMDAVIRNQRFEYQLWDTAGQEIYRNIVPIYFRGAVCAVVVFSLDDLQSFKNLQVWIDQLHNNTDSDVGIVIVGNKLDLENPRVQQSDAERWASDQKYALLWTSAATGQNVDILVEHIVTQHLAPAKVVSIGHQQTADVERGCC
jgi:small GTP-binding protein